MRPNVVRGPTCYCSRVGLLDAVGPACRVTWADMLALVGYHALYMDRPIKTRQAGPFVIGLIRYGLRAGPLPADGFAL